MTRVVVRLGCNGFTNYYSDGGEVDLFIIDERCPRDRVFLFTSHPAEEGVIDEMIGSDRIGQLGDMPGTENAIRALMDGEPPPRPFLSIVKPEETH